MNIATLELHSLKELIFLRKVIQDRKDFLLKKEVEESLSYSRHDTIEYLTLGQMLIRLPEPALLTPHVCTERDIETW